MQPLECRIHGLGVGGWNSRDATEKLGQDQIMKGFIMVQQFGFNSV